MAWPFTRLTTYVASTPPAIKAADLNAIQDAINALYGAPFFFMDSFDGSATLDGVAVVSWATKLGSVYTLTQDVFLDDLNVDGGVTLVGNSFRIFVGGILTVDGTIQNNGRAGTTTTPGGPAWDGGSIGGGSSGGARGTGGDPDGTPGTSLSACLGGTGGTGGQGDSTGALVAGSVGGGCTPPGSGYGGYRSLMTMLTSQVFGWGGSIGSTPTAFINVIMGGTGGGGGHYGNDTVANSSFGGPGGGGGGVLQICARDLVLNGSIEAVGGVGGDASVEAGAGFAGGGGGGGGGGVIFLLYGQKTGAGTVSVAGGAGGLQNAGGTNGVAGGSGLIVETQAVP